MKTFPIKYRYRWDTGGGWLEVPLVEYKLHPLNEFLTVRSRFDKELEIVYLDGESDALRYLDAIRKERGLTPLAKETLPPLASSEEIIIQHICEGRVSTIRQLPPLMKAKFK